MFLSIFEIGTILLGFIHKGFLGSNVSSPFVNSIFIAVKKEEAKKDRWPRKFIDQHNTKRSLIPKKYCA
jgi:hypothetical protein